MQGVVDIVVNCDFDTLMDLDNLDILSFFYGALVHDLKHPGFNNGFLINMKSEIAIIYNGMNLIFQFIII